MPQKYEREIDEILRRLDVAAPRESVSRQAGGRIRDWLAERWPRLGVQLTPTHLLAAGLLAALAGYLVGGVVPAVGRAAGLLALALFLTALGLSIARSRRRRPIGWRGRMLTYSPTDGTIWRDWQRRWQRWLQSRRRRR